MGAGKGVGKKSLITQGLSDKRPNNNMTNGQIIKGLMKQKTKYS